MVWENTLESLLDNKEIKPVHPNQPRTFIGRTVAEALDAKSGLIGKDLKAGGEGGDRE